MHSAYVSRNVSPEVAGIASGSRADVVSHGVAKPMEAHMETPMGTPIGTPVTTPRTRRILITPDRSNPYNPNYSGDNFLPDFES